MYEFCFDDIDCLLHSCLSSANLRNDTKYVTAFSDAGWTNGVMTQMNLIYLGIISSRVPVLPSFSPMHIGFDSENFHFGDVFDLPRLRKAVGHPILEWRDLKDHKSIEQDIFGCWSTWAVDNGQPRISRLHWTIHMGERSVYILATFANTFEQTYLILQYPEEHP